MSEQRPLRRSPNKSNASSSATTSNSQAVATNVAARRWAGSRRSHTAFVVSPQDLQPAHRPADELIGGA